MSERFDRYTKRRTTTGRGISYTTMALEGKTTTISTDYVLNLLESEKQKLAKAYGGCTLLWQRLCNRCEFWRGRGKTWGRPNKIKIAFMTEASS